MDDQPTLVETFESLDEAESALDWIGVEFVESDGAFEGVLGPDDRDLLDEALGDPDSPPPVRTLALALAELLDVAGDDRVAWRVAFDY
ncbi:MAG TPA: hypothetical protein VIH37_10945 [Candidatus Limnocylindrales bacterium]